MLVPTVIHRQVVSHRVIPRRVVSHRRPRSLTEDSLPPGFRLALVAVVEVGAVLLARLGLTQPQATGLFLLVAVAGSIMASLSSAVATGALSWACLTGFVVNAFGTLTLSRPDVARLVACVAAAALTAAGCAGVERVRRRRRA